MKWHYLLPLGVFVVLVSIMALGLKRDPTLVPSPLIGRAAPSIELPQLDGGTMALPEEMAGKVWLLNIWASWCAACKVEHPVLVEAATEHNLTLIGLDYKDSDEAARQWLQRYQNPYRHVVVDHDGTAGLDWGVYGVPETFIIDQDGIVRHKHIGPVSRDQLRDEWLPLIRQLEAS
ncbi:DsbE family thiol:disulfide interchange protein [Gammaproteobacteria bacterium]|nr:DsbE family thiol:disulfide interchange protein [Gammaproteobacteria bacterium]